MKPHPAPQFLQSSGLPASAMLAALQHVESFEERLFYAIAAAPSHVADTVPAPTASAFPLAVPDMHTNSLQFVQSLLKTGLFSTATGPRKFFQAFTPIPSSGSVAVEYRGIELRQDDQRVLLVLLKAKAGSSVAGPLEFNLRTFARDELGWADSSDSVSKLRGCLDRMMTSNLHVKYAYSADAQKREPRPMEGWYNFVATVEIWGGACRVTLNPNITALFAHSQTYLDIRTRRQLGDGLKSWLWAYISADPCQNPLPVQALQAQSCKEGYAPKEFNRCLRVALADLKELGLVTDFYFVNMKNGKGRGVCISKP